MSNEVAVITVNEIERIAQAMAVSKLFGMKTKEEAFALMMIAQGEGLHPAIAARDYHIVNGRPTLKADAMLARFQASGGRVEWNSYTDECCDATLSHPQGGTVRVMWDMARVKKAQISNAAMYSKYPRNMLRARVISEGIRTIYPGVAVGVYTPEEATDFDPVRETAKPHQVQTLDAQFTEVKDAPLPTGDLKQKAKEFAEALEIAPNLEMLERLVSQNAETTGKLSVELPAWHMKLLTKINEKRVELSIPQEEPKTLGEILDPPDFLKRSHAEAAE